MALKFDWEHSRESVNIETMEVGFQDAQFQISDLIIQCGHNITVVNLDHRDPGTVRRRVNFKDPLVIRKGGLVSISIKVYGETKGKQRLSGRVVVSCGNQRVTGPQISFSGSSRMPVPLIELAEDSPSGNHGSPVEEEQVLLKVMLNGQAGQTITLSQITVRLTADAGLKGIRLLRRGDCIGRSFFPHESGISYHQISLDPPVVIRENSSICLELRATVSVMTDNDKPVVTVQPSMIIDKSHRVIGKRLVFN
jgi:hypothetical protein